jgi:hypothetical protein
MQHFDAMETYTPRPVRCVDLWQMGAWRLKLYSIAYNRPIARLVVVQAARALVEQHLPHFAQGKTHYGVGFVGIHDGRGAIFVFMDFWAAENELHHHLFVAPADAPDCFEYVTPTGLTACVWDLRVLCHERQAWIDKVLANPQGPDLEGYLTRQLNEVI